ncbi:MAG: hypothetical protein IGS03_17415 [Candidatus Sericytochromatia bacterium]|nr:hypothetical protein [Candidatus Sericytochromatia bacterium]
MLAHTRSTLRLLLTSLLALVSTLPAQALSDSAWVIERDSRYVEWEMGGGSYRLAGESHQQMQFRGLLEYGLLENTTFRLAYPFLIRSRAHESGEPERLVNNGFTDLFLGSRVQLLDEPFGLALSGGFRVPTGYNPALMPTLGNGLLDMELSLLGGWDFFPLEAYIQGGAGYRFRTNFPREHALVAQAAAAGREIEKPADQILLLAEGGIWLSESWFAALTLKGEIALNQTRAQAQSQVLLRPLLAWRVQPVLDLSLQLEQSLWTQNQPHLTQVMLGAHFRYGLPLTRGKGLRGGIPDYARRE